MGYWTLETIDWHRFDPSKVDPEIVRNIKAAAMVERNGDDYGVYLRRVFADDPDFILKVDEWVSEETQHGHGHSAAGRSSADPGWDFEGRRSPRFKFRLPSAVLHHHDQVGCAAARRGEDDGALHRRDGDQLLLQCLEGRDRRACPEADLHQDRGPTNCATTSCSTTR